MDLGGIITLLKVAPGIALFPLTYILARRKLSHKAEVFYRWSWSVDSAERVEWMLIRNLKEKPLEIFAIHASIHGDFRLEIYRSKSPLIIKSMECAELEFEPISFYQGRDRFFATPGVAEIDAFYLTTADRVIRAKAASLPEALELRYFGDTRVLTAVRYKHRDRVYSADAEYALDYLCNGEPKTSLVLRSGFIVGDRPINGLSLNREELSDESEVESAVRAKFGDEEFSDLTITRLRHDGYQTARARFIAGGEP